MYCVPFRLDTRTIVYRKDIFEEVGQINIPPIYLEMLETSAEKLNKIENGRLIRAGFDPSERSNWNTQLYMEFLWQNGGEALNETETEAAFNSPEGVEALEFLANIKQMVLPPEFIRYLNLQFLILLQDKLRFWYLDLEFSLKLKICQII